MFSLNYAPAQCSSSLPIRDLNPFTRKLVVSGVLTLYKLFGNVCFHRVPHLQPVSLCDSGWVMGSCCRWSFDDVLTVSSTLSFQNKILYSP